MTCKHSKLGLCVNAYTHWLCCLCQLCILLKIQSSSIPLLCSFLSHLFVIHFFFPSFSFSFSPFLPPISFLFPFTVFLFLYISFYLLFYICTSITSLPTVPSFPYPSLYSPLPLLPLCLLYFSFFHSFVICLFVCFL